MELDTPAKEDLAKELRRLLTTLTEEAQRAAVRKCTELGFDQNKGRISLEESLINLTQGRDILLDAIDKTKFVQLPLKLQYQLFDQVRAIARELTALVTGTDAVVNLELVVEDLNASVWQFQLQNLSGQVLGFQSKMNQLKSQETAIRQAVHAAGELATLRQKADDVMGAASAHARSVADQSAAVTKLVEQLQATLRESTEVSQRVSGIAAQIAQSETATVQQLATAKQAAADTEAIAVKSRDLRTEIESARESLQDLTAKTQQLLAKTEQANAAQEAAVESKLTQVYQSMEAGAAALSTKLESSMTELSAQTAVTLGSITTAADARLTKLVDDAAERVAKNEATQDGVLRSQLLAFQNGSEAALSAFLAKGDESIGLGNASLKRLVDELDELEGRIRTAIERATGFSLFHAFQERQLEIVKAKVFWARALGGCVFLSVCASAAFIYYASQVHVYDAAFYLVGSLNSVTFFL